MDLVLAYRIRSIQKPSVDKSARRSDVQSTRTKNQAKDRVVSESKFFQSRHLYKRKEAREDIPAT